MAAKKEILKSVRMTQEVFNYIDGFDGSGFNQKFENLVLFCMKAEEKKKQMIATYDSMIDSRKDVLSKLRAMENALYQMEPMFDRVIKQAKCLLRDGQQAKKPVIGADSLVGYDDEGEPIWQSDYACPECGMGVLGEYICCPYCGQAFDWKEENDE